MIASNPRGLVLKSVFCADPELKPEISRVVDPELTLAPARQVALAGNPEQDNVAADPKLYKDTITLPVPLSGMDSEPGVMEMAASAVALTSSVAAG